MGKGCGKAALDDRRDGLIDGEYHSDCKICKGCGKARIGYAFIGDYHWACIKLSPCYQQRSGRSFTYGGRDAALRASRQLHDSSSCIQCAYYSKKVFDARQRISSVGRFVQTPMNDLAAEETYAPGYGEPGCIQTLLRDGHGDPEVIDGNGNNLKQQ
uniref:Uncharacterized protein n=1 Tax=Marseillevirus LCMAC202 TaxID=2506606 RepID=A0A481YYT3_9VIRU|nr:MAG: hypothetical protein LCMAC202_06810 [Marseillevirus LCMAC202]